MNSSAMRSPTISTRRLLKPSMRSSRRSLRSASPGNGCTDLAMSIRSESAEYPAGRGDQVVDHCVGGQISRLPVFLAGAVAGAHQHALCANRTAKRDVEPPVADHKGFGRIDPELLHRPVDETSPGLSTVARLRVPGHLAVGMVGTIVVRVDARAALVQKIRHALMHGVDDRLGEETAGDARLVRYEHNREASPIEHANRIDRPRKQLDPLGTIEVAHLLDDGAVAVQEDGAFKCRRLGTRDSGLAGRGLIAHSIRRVAASTSAAAIPRMHM